MSAKHTPGAAQHYAALLASREGLRKVLQAIYVECAGPGRPSDPESYLPPRLVDMAREALEQARGERIPVAGEHGHPQASAFSNQWWA